MTLDNIIHLSEALAIIGSAWRLSRKINRFIDVMIEYPPHRHINGKVLYPKGFDPGKVEGASSPS